MRTEPLPDRHLMALRTRLPASFLVSEEKKRKTTTDRASRGWLPDGHSPLLVSHTALPRQWLQCWFFTQWAYLHMQMEAFCMDRPLVVECFAKQITKRVITYWQSNAGKKWRYEMQTGSQLRTSSRSIDGHGGERSAAASKPRWVFSFGLLEQVIHGT